MIDCIRLYTIFISTLFIVVVVLNIKWMMICSSHISSDLQDTSLSSVSFSSKTVRNYSAVTTNDGTIIEESIIDDWSVPIDFWSDSWKSRFDIRIKRFFEHSQKDIKPVLLINKSVTDLYSRLTVVDSILGIRLLSIDNVCYDFYQQQFMLFSKEDFNIKKKRIPENFPMDAWSFNFSTILPPASQQWLDGDGLYFMVSNSKRNIAHFTEVFNFVYHYLHNRNLYPDINSVFFPQFDKDVIYPWIINYIEMTKSIFPAEQELKTVFLDDMDRMTSGQPICFRHIIGVGRISSIYYGGIFTSIAEADSVRAAAYRYNHIPQPQRQLRKVHVLIMLREAVHGNLPGRAIVNVDDVRQWFNERQQMYDYSEKKLELLSPAQQVMTMAITDVFIGAIGSGFTNVLYMMPGSVVISYSPPNIGGFFFHTESEFARIHYIGVYNSSVEFPPVCNNRVSAFGQTTVRACLDDLYQSSIYMELEQLQNLMHMAVIHLNSVKYRDPL